MDVDPEYDPSDFLQLGRPQAVPVATFETEVVPTPCEDTAAVEMHHFPVSSFSQELSEPAPVQQELGLQDQQGGGIDADLEVSDSDEEVKAPPANLTEPAPPPEEEDGGDLWF